MLQEATQKEQARMEKEETKEQAVQSFVEEQNRARMKYEIEIQKKQAKMEKDRLEEVERKMKAKRMEPWRDSEQPEAYLTRFESVMVDAAIQKRDWITRLVPLLTGKALVAYSNYVLFDAFNNYETMKEAMLEAPGLSINHCRRILEFSEKKSKKCANN